MGNESPSGQSPQPPSRGAEAQVPLPSLVPDFFFGSQQQVRTQGIQR